MIVSTGANFYIVYKSALAATSGPDIRDIFGASWRLGEGNDNLVYPSPWEFKRSF
jgi:hypothetical protein